MRLATMLFLLMTVHTSEATKEDLYGTWRLVSFVQQNPDTGAKITSKRTQILPQV